MSASVVVGSQWGDEGKGKVVDCLARRAHAVIRYGGGSNAGHTVAVGGQQYKLNLLPSGILYPGTLCLLGNGVVIDPKALLAEMDAIAARGVDVSGLRVSDRAHVVMPWHALLDGLSERQLGGARIGTTGRGIGPCYADKAARVGIRVCDLIDRDEFPRRLREVLALKNETLARVHGHAPLDFDSILAEYSACADRLRPYVCDTIALANRELDDGKRVLLEGAQATMLDLDYGTYPYVTSSHPVSGGACVGAGIAPGRLRSVVGVAKAYCTRVGSGPFPTEQPNAVGDALREAGHEYGTVTGRPRRTGWLDAVVVRYAAMLSGMTHLAVTRLDILDGFDEVRMCTGYRLRGEPLGGMPASLRDLAAVEPVYESFPGWRSDITGARAMSELPAAARAYLGRLAQVAGVPVALVGVGPERDQIIVDAPESAFF